MVKTALALLCLAALAGAQERAFIESRSERDTYYVHEPVRVTLVIGYDRAYFESHAIQLFSRRLDIPVQVEAPWLQALPGAVAREEPVGGVDGGVTIALNGDSAMAVPAKDRPPYAVIRLGRTYLPTRAGELLLPAPSLRYAYGTRFAEDFINGRVAVDRHEVTVTGGALRLTILPLPEEGRPAGFTGAVGSFLISAKVAPREVDAGAILKLTLTVEGDGNLERIPTPRLAGLTGFHLYGTLDDRGAATRTVTYDLAPLSPDVVAVPSIPFVYFDPGPPGAYRTATTPPIPITVRAAGTDLTVPAPEPNASGLNVPLMIGAGLLALAVATGLWLRARLRDARARARDASDLFTARLAEPDVDLADAFAGYLAARMRCPTASVIGPDLAARLTGSGVPAHLAARAAGLLEDLVAARYGGGTPSDSAEAAARELVVELDAAFQAWATGPQ